MRGIAVAGALAVCAVAVLGTGSGTAAGAEVPAGDACTTKPQVLANAPGSTVHGSAVQDLGAGKLSVGSSAGVPVYWTGRQVHPLPLPAGYTSGVVNAVNRHGLMVGSVYHQLTGSDQAFSYRAGDAALTLLPRGGFAADVNDSGLIVGGAHGQGYAREGFVWQDGQVVRELEVPELSDLMYVTGINNRGDIVGEAEIYIEVDGSILDWQTIPLVWSADPAEPARKLVTAGPVHELFRYSVPRGIDESGRVAGYDWYGPGSMWTPWDWAPPYDQPGSSPGVLAGYPYGTLDAISPTTGVLVGTANSGEFSVPPPQAQLWPGSGPMQALPLLAPDRASTAVAVADDGRVGGSAVNAKGVKRAVVWQCAAQPTPGS